MRLRWMGVMLGVLTAVVGCGLAQPRLVVSKPAGYGPGDTIDREMFVLGEDLKPVPILDLVEPETRLLVLVIFGGGAATPPEAAFRGPLWCEDSFDDLAVQRALVRQFHNQPIRFVPVAIPPIYSTTRYGYEDNVFLSKPEEAPEFQSALRLFVDRTEAARRSTLLPYEHVYFDPKSRLCLKLPSGELPSGFGTVYPWQGKLRWHRDARKYGVPTIWVLDREGKILTTPFWGNDYDTDPPQVRYGFAEVRDTLQQLLNQAEAASPETP